MIKCFGLFWSELRFLDIYQCLGTLALERSIMRWPFKPKFHVSCLGHITSLLFVVLLFANKSFVKLFLEKIRARHSSNWMHRWSNNYTAYDFNTAIVTKILWGPWKVWRSGSIIDWWNYECCYVGFLGWTPTCATKVRKKMSLAGCDLEFGCSLVAGTGYRFLSEIARSSLSNGCRWFSATYHDFGPMLVLSGTKPNVGTYIQHRIFWVWLYMFNNNNNNNNNNKITGKKVWKTKIFASSLRRAQLRRPDVVLLRIMDCFCQHFVRMMSACIMSYITSMYQFPCQCISVYPNISHNCPPGCTAQKSIEGTDGSHRPECCNGWFSCCTEPLVPIGFSGEGGREAEGSEGREREA